MYYTQERNGRQTRQFIRTFHDKITVLRARLNKDRSQRPRGHRDCGFEFRLGHGCVSFVNVMFCQARTVQTSEKGRSIVQRSLTGLARQRERLCVCFIEGDQVQQYPPIPTMNKETEVRIKETERLLRG
jgi:hypothetical protein